MTKIHPERPSRRLAHGDRAPGAPDDPAPNGATDIRQLFSFQLQRLAGVSTRIAALSLRPRFGVTPREWRALAVLGYLDEAPLQELARHAGLLKSQMSRTVAALIERDLIKRAANPSDGRSVLLRLTPGGRDLVSAVLRDSFDRNERMLAPLSPDERVMLAELIGRVFDASLAFYGEIRRSAPTHEEEDE